MNTLFLIGPGGVGKSTVGALLAQAMNYRFIDLDSEFCEQLLNIRQYIQRNGYECYVRDNAALCSRLLAENPHKKRVVVLSSGFLATDVCPEIVAVNRQLVRQSGYSILLLPSDDIDIATRIVVARQLMRGFGLVREKEEMKFRQRFREYCALDDCRVVSSEEPERVAELVREKVAAEQRKQKSLEAMRELSELSQKLGLYN
ncbi:shikimate kinase [Klebsiella grimontii]|uniref:Shikimate kinase n=2 Tax=Enterobacteriaceae TaxID=543 RepID=A0ABU9NZZ3_9ENTR|nr:shikimate kinase [Klebsiella grimontii]MDU1425464.1 shikimate kinase [Klebsiella michiganensis]MDU7869110.1 shikimate kinase [Pantoea sp.]MBZ6948602.1 shikimate kinase [Klebsiella grimontii]MDU4544209.1 shikimate kinase [Klebsiella michiganensis]MDU6354513.1 shikimate kinase [Klebsiella grimontii]